MNIHMFVLFSCFSATFFMLNIDYHEHVNEYYSSLAKKCLMQFCVSLRNFLNFEKLQHFDQWVMRKTLFLLITG